MWSLTLQICDLWRWPLPLYWCSWRSSVLHLRSLQLLLFCPFLFPVRSHPLRENTDKQAPVPLSYQPNQYISQRSNLLLFYTDWWIKIRCSIGKKAKLDDSIFDETRVQIFHSLLLITLCFISISVSAHHQWTIILRIFQFTLMTTSISLHETVLLFSRLTKYGWAQHRSNNCPGWKIILINCSLKERTQFLFYLAGLTKVPNADLLQCTGDS